VSGSQNLVILSVAKAESKDPDEVIFKDFAAGIPRLSLGMTIMFT
jgi:hypothetical protein